MNGEERPFQLKNLSLILCPNVTLCEQVVRMVNGFLGEDGNPLLRVEAVCGSQSIARSECPSELEPADKNIRVHVDLVRREENFTANSHSFSN